MSAPRTSRILDRLLVALYTALAALPALAMLLGLRGHELAGELPPAPQPELAAGAILEERFQRDLAAWFERDLGLKGTSITTDNTILYHAFRETKPGSTVRIGRGGVLFSHEDIDYFNKQGPWLPDPAYVERLADQIAELQRRLAAGGRALVPVIVPAKTSIWRDAVPAAWTLALGDPADRPSDRLVYRAFRAALERRGVAFVDARALFAERIAAGVPRADLYGPDARHWSRYGACLAMREVAALHARLTGRPRPPHECAFTRIHGRRSNVDFDLLRLLNARYVYPAVRELPFVAYAPPAAPPAAPRPRTLFIGTSFCWTLLQDAEDSGAYGTIRLDYYHQTLMTWPEREATPIDPASPAWRTALREQDLYVLDLFEGYLAAPGAYVELFLDQALGYLRDAVPAGSTTSW
jgi:hypothetical protein